VKTLSDEEADCLREYIERLDNWDAGDVDTSTDEALLERGLLSCRREWEPVLGDDDMEQSVMIWEITSIGRLAMRLYAVIKSPAVRLI
jgi:hypothetical protein